MSAAGQSLPVYAASQLAWPGSENSRAFALLRKFGYTGVEIVPAKAFASWEETTDAAADQLKRRLAAEGLSVPAMQAIFFGVGDMHVFEGDHEREALTSHILRCGRLADALGAKVIVFGAPKLRDPGAIASDEAWRRAADYFAGVGEQLAQECVATMTMEPVAPHHGGTFLCTHLEMARFIAEVNQPRIRQQFDLGCWLTYAEDETRLAEVAKFVAHSHISAPHLGSIDASVKEGARRCFPALQKAGYAGAVSVEMLDGKLNDNWPAALEEARWSEVFV